MDLLSLKEHHARTLLIHYRWDVEKLLAVLVEKGNASLFMEAGVSLIEKEHPISPLPPTVMCDICIDDVLGFEASKMDCGHCFCNNCKCDIFFSLHSFYLHPYTSYRLQSLDVCSDITITLCCRTTE